MHHQTIDQARQSLEQTKKTASIENSNTKQPFILSDSSSQNKFQTTQQEYLKKLNELQRLKKQVKRMPFSMLKDFIIYVDQQGNLVNPRDLISMSMESNANDNIVSSQSFIQKEIQNKTLHGLNKFLFIKLKAEKEAVYLSCNTEISTLDKIRNLAPQRQGSDQQSKQNQDESYEFNVDNQSEQQQSKKELFRDIKNNCTLCRETLSQIVKPFRQNNIKEQTQSKNQSKKQAPSGNLQKASSKPSTSTTNVPNLRKKQSLPLKEQCNILSHDLSHLKKKIESYIYILEEKSRLDIVDPLQELSEIKQLDELNHEQVESRIRAHEDDLGRILTDSWKVEKEQYISYIQKLEEELNELRTKLKDAQRYNNQEGYKFSFNNHQNGKTGNNTGNHLGQMPGSGVFEDDEHQQKRRSLKIGKSQFADSAINYTSQLSPIKGYEQPQESSLYFKSPSVLNSKQNHSAISSSSSPYYKNQYRVNESSKSKPKMKKSKIIYLGR